MSGKRDISHLLICQERFLDPSLPSGLWWCASAEDVMAVGLNAVCKATLAEWEELSECKAFVEQFPYILVAMPDTAQRDEVVEQLQMRFSTQILVADSAAFRGNASVSELLKNIGQSAVDSLLYNSSEIPTPGLLDLSQVELTERTVQNRCMSGILTLDYCVGGFRGGELSVWTGKRGEGKSTILSQLLCDAVNQNRVVCAYSGELPARQFKRFILPQIAGPGNLEAIPDPATGRTNYMPARDVQAAIEAWMKGRFLLTDIKQATAHDEDTILRLFEYAYRKYGCSVYLVDNIMTASLKMERDLGYYQAQSAFVQRLSAFAKQRDVHIHLVAHPRKTDRQLDADAVGGSGDITNRADNVFALERVEGEDGPDARLRILKVRENGCRETVPLSYEERSRRYSDFGEAPNKHYSWEALLNGHG